MCRQLCDCDRHLKIVRIETVDYSLQVRERTVHIIPWRIIMLSVGTKLIGYHCLEDSVSVTTLGHSSAAGVGPRKEVEKEVEMEEEMEV